MDQGLGKRKRSNSCRGRPWRQVLGTSEAGWREKGILVSGGAWWEGAEGRDKAGQAEKVSRCLMGLLVEGRGEAGVEGGGEGEFGSRGKFVGQSSALADHLRI